MSPRAYIGSTTFVQTDPSTFKGLVQRLTGPHEGSPPCPKAPGGIKRPTFKLHERRRGSRPKLAIVKPNPSSSPSSPCSPPLISPSNSISKLRLSDLDSSSDEEKAIKEGRFYLYSSPGDSRLRNVDPEQLLLLHLFPES